MIRKKLKKAAFFESSLF